MTVCVRFPDVPVMVMVELPFGVPELAQPANATNTSNAPTRPRRVRKRRSDRNSRSIRNAANTGVTMRMETGGKRGAEEGGGATSEVVAMVTAALIVPFAGGVTEDGAIMQVDFLGAPEHVSATAELKPPVEMTFTLNIPEEPFLIVRTPDCDVVKLKLGATAVTVPVRATVCTPAPSVMVSVAVSMAETEGV